MRSQRMLGLIVALGAFYSLPPVTAQANTTHQGWPFITGMLLQNVNDSDRPLDARPGRDPFAGQDPTYSCDTMHFGRSGRCKAFLVRGPDGRPVVSADRVHNELLGGHGDDTIHAGPVGDVIWGDFKPTGNTVRQHDRLYGGPGDDFIYASHGRNVIRAGAGMDVIHSHFGRGIADCGAGYDVIYLARSRRKGWKLRDCERISYRTGESAPRDILRKLASKRPSQPAQGAPRPPVRQAGSPAPRSTF